MKVSEEIADAIEKYIWNDGSIFALEPIIDKILTKSLDPSSLAVLRLVELAKDSDNDDIKKAAELVERSGYG